MRTFVSALTAVATAATFGTAASAATATWTADFSSTAALEEDWLVDPTAQTGSFTASGGVLTNAYSRGATQTPSGGRNNIVIAPDLLGDFVAQIDIDFSGLANDVAGPTGIHMDASFGAFFTPGYSAGFSAFNGAAGNQVVTSGFIAGAPPSYTTPINPNKAVTFRLERVGDTLTQSWALVGSSIFTTMGTATNAAYASGAGFVLGSNHSGSQAGSATIKYSNFTVVYDAELNGDDDETPGVPEPASWAMMLAGFGLVGGAMRRRGRTAVSFG